MLQNHIGDVELPVRPRARHALEVRQLRQVDQRSKVRDGLWVLLPAVAVCVALLALRDVVLPLLPATFHDVYLALAAVSMLPVALVASLAMTRRYRSLPQREQRRYRQLAATPPLTVHQQQLLALDAQSDYAGRCWNGSLEYVPSWRCLPADVRARWEQRTDRPLFTTLAISSVSHARADVDARYRVASQRDLELRVVDVLTGWSPGSPVRSLSGRFGEMVAGPDADRGLARLASLTGRDEWELRGLAASTPGRAPQLVRGADVQWLVSLVRACYVAEIIDEGTAWRLLERVAAVAAETFSSWDEYWRSVRTGHAYANDSLEAVQRFDSALEGLRASNWPAARLPWLTSKRVSHG